MRKRLMLTLVLLPLALAACAGKGPLQRGDTAYACAELVMPMKARLIKLPSGGATMESATLVAAAEPAPESCRVLGRILAADQTEPPIRFEVTLPTQWNGRAVYYGSDAAGAAAQLAEGYAIYGFDAGAEPKPEVPPDPADPANQKLRDVAVQLMMRAYGRGPQKIYFVDGQEDLA
jgi:Tannase and feruloyl esterase